MSVRLWTPFFLLLFTASAFAETRYLDPPPLNPHPKEALHVTATFDRQEDASRYSIRMKAPYENRQSECGYVDQDWSPNPVYLGGGAIVITNKSLDPRKAKFDIYLDRYDRATCNWELGNPSIEVHDRYTGSSTIGSWGRDNDLIPGTEFRMTCPFPDTLAVFFPCFDRGNPVPDTDFFNRIPASRRVQVTVSVSRDSAPLHPRHPSFYFPLPPLPNDKANPLPLTGSNR